MQKLFIALLASSAVLTSGCATTAKTTTPAPAPAIAAAPAAAKPAPAPTLGIDAQAALAEAKSYVAAAQAKNALWTKTTDALKAAEAAAKEVNDAAVIKNAKFATETAKISMDQLTLPTTEHFKK
jgi:uncharacterized protein YceK